MFTDALRSQLPSLVLPIALAAAGCTAPAESEAAASTDAPLTSAREPALEVKASYRIVFSGIPTIGSEPDRPLLTVEVTVDDQLLREKHPGFDSFERAFAIVPRRSDGQTRFERIELPFDHRELRGFIQLRYVEVHRVENLPITMADLSAARSDGIAVGLDTNVGTVWAQDFGKNIVPTPANL